MILKDLCKISKKFSGYMHVLAENGFTVALLAVFLLAYILVITFKYLKAQCH